MTTAEETNITTSNTSDANSTIATTIIASQTSNASLYCSF
jgi:hypothetical protein